MTRRPAPGLPASVVTRLVPRAVGSDWTPDTEQGVLLWEGVETGSAESVTATTEPAAGELHAWTTRFAQAVVEVVAGHRPPSQLVRWTSRAVFRDLERRTRLTQRAATATGGLPVQRSTLRPQVRSVHVCRVGPDTAEASVHVRHGRRSRAVALRLETTLDRNGATRWTCTAIEFA
jgi:hypothetical protein